MVAIRASKDTTAAIKFSRAIVALLKLPDDGIRKCEVC